MNMNRVALRRMLRRRLYVAALAALAGAWVTCAPLTTAAANDAQTGKEIFQKNCTACHTIGQGNLVGPDLAGVTGRRPHEWLLQWIAAPDRMLAAKDPVATGLLHQFHDVAMPNLGLSASSVAAVVDYLGSTASSAPTAGSAAAPAQAASVAAPATSVAAPATSVAAPATSVAVPATSASTISGNPEVGKELFTGLIGFQNGGPPCMACHSVSGIGALGGGQLGPDLTTVITRYGGTTALAAFVGGSPTPTMNAIWSKHPLTANERADVVAFLAQAPLTQRSAEAIWQLAGLAVLGLAILLAVSGWVWRKRLRDGVRRPMITRQRRASQLARTARAPRRT